MTQTGSDSGVYITVQGSGNITTQFELDVYNNLLPGSEDNFVSVVENLPAGTLVFDPPDPKPLPVRCHDGRRDTALD
jgi:hypothetical protein